MIIRMNEIPKLFNAFNDIITKWQLNPSKIELSIAEIAIFNWFNDEIFQAIGAKRTGKHKEFIEKL